MKGSHLRRRSQSRAVPLGVLVDHVGRLARARTAPHTSTFGCCGRAPQRAQRGEEHDPRRRSRAPGRRHRPAPGAPRRVSEARLRSRRSLQPPALRPGRRGRARGRENSGAATCTRRADRAQSARPSCRRREDHQPHRARFALDLKARDGKRNATTNAAAASTPSSAILARNRRPA